MLCLARSYFVGLEGADFVKADRNRSLLNLSKSLNFWRQSTSNIHLYIAALSSHI